MGSGAATTERPPDERSGSQWLAPERDPGADVTTTSTGRGEEVIVREEDDHLAFSLFLSFFTLRPFTISSSFMIGG